MACAALQKLARLSRLYSTWYCLVLLVLFFKFRSTQITDFGKMGSAKLHASFGF
jgi:hypothetical protein